MCFMFYNIIFLWNHPHQAFETYAISAILLLLFTPIPRILIKYQALRYVALALLALENQYFAALAFFKDYRTPEEQHYDIP